MSAIKKILIVEDNELNMELAVDILEQAGHEVIQATSAEKGIQLARSEMPDLILMDTSLPGMDGLAATRILRSDPVTEKISVVSLTAHAMSGDEQKALAAGCNGYVIKPINTRTFAQRIAEFLASSAAPEPASAGRSKKNS